MKRVIVCVLVMFGVSVLSGGLPAHSQEKAFELSLGPQYPLLSQEFDIVQDPAYHARFGIWTDAPDQETLTRSPAASPCARPHR